MIPPRRSALVVLLVAAAPAATAQKVDTLTFRNGDRVTGEIKRLSRGELEYSTSPMGTVEAKWTHVVRIESPRFFELTGRSGARYYGALRAAPDTGRVIVIVASEVERRVGPPACAGGPGTFQRFCRWQFCRGQKPLSGACGDYMITSLRMEAS